MANSVILKLNYGSRSGEVFTTSRHSLDSLEVYNSIANTSKWVPFLPPSDVYVKSFLYPFYTLINSIAHTHTKEIPGIFGFELEI